MTLCFPTLLLQSALTFGQMANEAYSAYKQHTGCVSEPPGGLGQAGRAGLCLSPPPFCICHPGVPGPQSEEATDEGRQRKNARFSSWEEKQERRQMYVTDRH